MYVTLVVGAIVAFNIAFVVYQTFRAAYYLVFE